MVVRSYWRSMRPLLAAAMVLAVTVAALWTAAAPVRAADEEYPGWTGTAQTGISGFATVKLAQVNVPAHANAVGYIRFALAPPPLTDFGYYSAYWKCGTWVSNAGAGTAQTRLVILTVGLDSDSDISRSCSLYIWVNATLTVYESRVSILYGEGDGYPLIPPPSMPPDPSASPDPSATPAPTPDPSATPSASPCFVELPEGYLGPPAPTACPTPSPTPTPSVPWVEYSCTVAQNVPCNVPLGAMHPDKIVRYYGHGMDSVGGGTYPGGVTMRLEGQLSNGGYINWNNTTDWPLYSAACATGYDGDETQSVSAGQSFVRYCDAGQTTYTSRHFAPGIARTTNTGFRLYAAFNNNGGLYPTTGRAWWRIEIVDPVAATPTPGPSASLGPVGNGTDGGPLPSDGPALYVPGTGTGVGGGPGGTGPCVPGPLTGECKPGSGYAVMPECPNPFPSINPIDYFGWIGCLLSGIPTAIGNGLTWLLNGLVDLFVPAPLGPFSQLGSFLTMVQEKAPFGYVPQLAAALTAPAWAGPVPGLSFSIAGETIDAGVPLTAAVGALAPFRGVFEAFVWLLLAFALLRLVRGALGGGDSGGGGE